MKEPTNLSSQSGSTLTFGVDLANYNNYPGPGELSKALNAEIHRVVPDDPAVVECDLLSRATWNEPGRVEVSQAMKNEPVLGAAVVTCLGLLAKDPEIRAHVNPSVIAQQLLVMAIYGLQLGMAWERIRQQRESESVPDIDELNRIYGLGE